MPNCIVILHALHYLSFSFTITFTFNNHKTIVEVHYNIDNNILTSSHIINNIYIHSLRCLSVCLISISLSLYLSIYLSTYLLIYLPTYLSIYLSIYLSVYLPHLQIFVKFIKCIDFTDLK